MAVEGMHLQFDTILNADAVEFCPVRGLRNLLICGTYQLKESDSGGRAEDQTRVGRLYCLSVTQNLESGSEESIHGGESFRLEIPQASQLALREQSQLDCPGVFDIKFSTGPFCGGALLGHAAADGFLYTYQVVGGEEERAISLLNSVDCRGSPPHLGALALSLDWSDRVRPAPGLPAAAVSLSDGSLCVVDMRPDGGLEVRRRRRRRAVAAAVAAVLDGLGGGGWLCRCGRGGRVTSWRRGWRHGTGMRTASCTGVRDFHVCRIAVLTMRRRRRRQRRQPSRKGPPVAPKACPQRPVQRAADARGAAARGAAARGAGRRTAVARSFLRPCPRGGGRGVRQRRRRPARVGELATSSD